MWHHLVHTGYIFYLEVVKAWRLSEGPCQNISRQGRYASITELEGIKPPLPRNQGYLMITDITNNCLGEGL